jgi:NAD+ synthase (glutamine-hydrolysing)
MQLIKVGAAVLNQTPFDWENNKKNILGAIHAAQAADVSVLCLPELCITGYGCEDDFFRTDLRERAWAILEELLPETGGMVVSLGLPVSYNNALFNCAALICDGELLGLVAKQNLAGDGIHYEPRWFEAWAEGVVSEITMGEHTVPIGDLYFRVGGVKIAFEICEDAWVGRRPGARLAPKGVDIFMNPSASHFSFGKLEIRKRLVLEGSRAFNATYLYTNLLGNEAGRAIYDGGPIIASAGKLVAIGPRFSYQDFELTVAVVDVAHTRMAQARMFSYRPEMKSPANDCVDFDDFIFPEVAPGPIAPSEQLEWELTRDLQEEEFARALSLGLFDYMRKTRSRGYTVSLSGGADSSCTVCLVSLMVEFGVKHFGVEGFRSKLSYIENLADAKNEKELVGQLLTCAYQTSDNSSESTLESARELANYLGAQFFEFNIGKVVDEYTSMVSGAIGRELDWQRDDIALQNIQARVRSPGIWLLANLLGTVLLCTSNRSEGAVGYCTMDGDTSGGLAPIAGVDKNFIRRWLRWLERIGPRGLHPYSALHIVNDQTPGPELRPQEMHQAGEKDLMPYDVLDAIEEAAIENNQSAKDCYLLMRARFPQFDANTMAKWIEKFFSLWSRNQWKRERLAPALHVASRNLDPRTWRRSPILSGGFREELKEMWDVAKRSASQAQPAHSALVCIDVQKGFGSHGELPVANAEEIVPIINKLMEDFDLVVASQDWHPVEHVSFAKTHGKKPGETVTVHGKVQPLFTPHCVQNTAGAEFIDGFDIERVDKVFRKGSEKGIDSFSAFVDHAGGKATDIEEYLRERAVKELYFCGLATNYCVYSSAMDAVKAGFKVFVVVDACRGIDDPPGAVQKSLDEMKSAGITLVNSVEVMNAVRR